MVSQYCDSVVAEYTYNDVSKVSAAGVPRCDGRCNAHKVLPAHPGTSRPGPRRFATMVADIRSQSLPVQARANVSPRLSRQSAAATAPLPTPKDPRILATGLQAPCCRRQRSGI